MIAIISNYRNFHRQNPFDSPVFNGFDIGTIARTTCKNVVCTYHTSCFSFLIIILKMEEPCREVRIWTKILPDVHVFYIWILVIWTLKLSFVSSTHPRGFTWNWIFLFSLLISLHSDPGLSNTCVSPPWNCCISDFELNFFCKLFS